MIDEELKQHDLELVRENAEFRKVNDILKNVLVFSQKVGKLKTSECHLFVNEYRRKYVAKAICRFLKISESGY